MRKGKRQHKGISSDGSAETENLDELIETFRQLDQQEETERRALVKKIEGAQENSRLDGVFLPFIEGVLQKRRARIDADLLQFVYDGNFLSYLLNEKTIDLVMLRDIVMYAEALA